MKTKKLTLLIATVFIFTYLLSMTVFAANVCSRIDGSASSATSFEITTDKKWHTSNYLILHQRKGKAEGSKLINGIPKVYDTYGRYTIIITDSNGKTTTERWTDGNFKIKNLKSNATYTVNVIPNSDQDYFNGFTAFINCGYYGWVQPATWYVKKTSGLTLCN